ncbi:hypothetical protein H8E07_20610, partial [bacterium]|nr:hypothetical protein [bacterium]
MVDDHELGLAPPEHLGQLAHLAHEELAVFRRTTEEQLGYLENLIKNFNLFYIEDAFGEEDFESFAKLLKKFPDRLIVGDDLTVTNLNRL